MATKTTNYNLVKPAYDEDADIAVINANMDIIDTKMKEIENAGGSGGTPVDAYTKQESDELLSNKVDKETGKGLSTNDYTDEEKNKLNAVREQVSELKSELVYYENLEKNNKISLPKEFPILPFDIYKGIDGKYHSTYNMLSENDDVDVRYVNTDSGNNNFNGTTIELAKLTIYNAISTSAKNKVIIYIVNNAILQGTHLANIELNGKYISIRPLNPNNHIFFCRRYPMNMVSTWNTYQTDVYVMDATINISGAYNINRKDEDGIIIPYDRCTTIDECVSNIYSWYYDSTAKKIYVHSDVKPNNTSVFVTYADNEYTITLNNNAKIEFENAIFGANGDGHSNILLDGDGTGFCYMKKCSSIGFAYLNSQPKDRGAIRVHGVNTLFENTFCSYDKGDGFQYFAAFFGNLKPQSYYVELNCKSYKCERGNSWSINGSTAHNNANILRVNTIAKDCASPCIADVGSCLSVLVDCTVDGCIREPLSEKKAFVFFGLSNSDYANVYMKDCKVRGQFYDSLVLGGDGATHGFVTNFKAIKPITITSGSDIDIW